MNTMRIMIFGRPGAGKSTFAFKLSQALGLPLYHLDNYFWLANWQERPRDEFMEIQNKLVDKDNWIIDGNCLKSLATRYARATHVIYFDYPRFTCYWRVFKRRFFKDATIADRAQGCREAIRWPLLKYMWNFEKRVAPSLIFLKEMFPNVPFYKVTCANDLARLRQELINSQKS